MFKNTELPFANGQKVTLEENGRSCTINLIDQSQVERLECVCRFPELTSVQNAETLMEQFRSECLDIFSDIDIADLLKKVFFFTIQHFEYVEELAADEIRMQIDLEDCAGFITVYGNGVMKYYSFSME